MNFNEKVAAQVAAFFLHRAGGQLEILKLMKLMYLAERESFRQHGEPLTGDTPYSMEHGPVLSKVLNHMNSMVDSQPGGWESWITDRADHRVGLRIPGDPMARLDHLSEADLEVLGRVWRDFGHMTGSQLRNWTHRNCAEWEDPDKSSVQIPYSRLLKAVGFDADTAAELDKRITAQRGIELAFTIGF